MSEQGIMLCGHGSRDPEAIHEFGALARQLAGRFDAAPVVHGYLEFARPIIRDGLEQLRRAGVRDILAVPGMLFAAGHAKNDIPSVLNTWQAEQRGVRVRYGRELAIDAKLLRASEERIAAAEAAAPQTVARGETLLLVVGRGTNDPDANSNVAKVARMLSEGMGFGWGETGFSGVAHPRTDAALARLVRLGFRRIIVFPYFLFTGVLVKRIYAAADGIAAVHPEIEVLKAGYLNDHPLVLETFVERVREIDQGANLMNCQLCKYRTQVLGFERDAGAPQVGHHHHVEGIGTDADHPHHDHSHDHAHDHGHSHDHVRPRRR